MKNFPLSSTRPLVLVLLWLVCWNSGRSAQKGTTSDPVALNTKKIAEFVRNHETAILKEYSEFLSIPDVAADRENIRRNADFLLSMLQKRAVRARLLQERDSPPVVYGELAAPKARKTILFYAHYDGQPVDLSQWKTNPWEAILMDKPLEEGGTKMPLESAQGKESGEWRLYARSASDDKAPIIAVLAALDALRSNGIPVSANVKFIFEGEEEAGSPHLASILEKHKDIFKADGMLLCDGPVHQTRRMQLLFGVRGTVDLELTVYGPNRALHSGHYGNWAPNPGAVMANVLAGLRDPDGKILIPGFYDDVRPFTPEEIKAVAEAPRVDDELRKKLQLGWSEANNTRFEERIMLPALNIRGIRSGHVGPEAQNAVPTEALASIDFRLVPDQTPESVRQKVEAHFISQGFYIVHTTPDRETRLKYPKIVKLEWGVGYPPSRTPMDIPFSRALADVLEESTRQTPIKLPTSGGSAPLYLFVDMLKLPVILFPIVNHDNSQHGPNENIRLQNLWDGIEMFAAVLSSIGDRWK